MDTVITVIQVLLGLLLTVGGLLKLTLPYAKYADLPGVAWSKDFKPGHIRLIGVLEVSGGVGLIVPLFLPSLTMLTPLAAFGIALYIANLNCLLIFWASRHIHGNISEWKEHVLDTFKRSFYIRKRAQ